MAYSKYQWIDAQGFFEAGLSLSQIQDKTGISRSAISKRAKSEQWKQGKNADYVKAREVIAEKKSTENQHLLNCADEVANDNIRRRGLIFGTTERLVKKIDDSIQYGKRLEKVNTGDGVQQLIPVDYGSSDFKNFADALDKMAVTLEVAPRHANAAQVAIQNNQTTNIDMSESNLLEEAKKRGLPIDLI